MRSNFVFFLLFFAFSSLAGWITHVITCLSQSEWGFLIAGAIFVPVGVVHGWGIWFGFW
jgi:hypothetical protein